jgi:hypothetical protein
MTHWRNRLRYGHWIRGVKEVLVQGHKIEWRVGQLPVADCDPALITQVFSNCLENGLKFMRRWQLSENFMVSMAPKASKVSTRTLPPYKPSAPWQRIRAETERDKGCAFRFTRRTARLRGRD